jgi:DNA (cytosine-5)-methyltransferase 1
MVGPDSSPPAADHCWKVPEKSSAPQATIGRVSAPPFTAISLFAGCGGLDAGFRRAGVDVQWAVDSDQMAVATYNSFLGERAVCGRVPDERPPTSIRPDLVIGGPPCQGFSVAGRMDPKDPRSRHVFDFLDVVRDVQPRAFVMENVKALGEAPNWRPTRQALIRDAEEMGYEVRLFILNAAHYDVPQARERMFLIGGRGFTPKKPSPVTRDQPPTVRQALANLPTFGELGNDTVCGARVVPAKSPVMRPTAYRGSLLFNGSGRPLALDAPAKTLPAAMGGNATPIIDQDELADGASPWVVEYHARLASGRPPLRRAPKRMRRITVEEAAALQTFPVGMQFAGKRISQYRQIGNAVPPRLAEHVAYSVVQSLLLSIPSIERVPIAA